MSPSSSLKGLTMTLKKNGFLGELMRNRHIYLLMLPGLLFFLIFSYLPMSGHLLAFKRYQLVRGIFGSPWVGLKNFKFFFSSKDWLPVTVNTLLLNLRFIVTNQLCAILIALFLNEIKNNAVKRISQSLIVLPYFVSWIVVYFMSFTLLATEEGMVNQLLTSLGAPRVSWYASPRYWPAILTVINAWKFAGYASIIYLSAMAGINPELYESALIDGANRGQQTWYITLPMIRRTALILILLALGRIFYGNFGMIYALVGDNAVLFETTDVIDTYTFRMLRVMGNFSMSAAIVLYQSVMGILMVIIFNRIVRKIDYTARLF